VKHLFIGGPADGTWQEVAEQYLAYPQRIRDDMSYADYMTFNPRELLVISVFTYLPFIVRIAHPFRGLIPDQKFTPFVVFRLETLDDVQTMQKLIGGYHHVDPCERCGYDEAPRGRRSRIKYTG